MSEEKPFTSNTDNIITLEDFDALLKKGEKLVILDDLVLDIRWFMGEHPGGLFTLEHNVGRDISKFFYGGYSLENQSKVPEHSHSNDARKIVNTLIVGRLVREAVSREVEIASVDRSANKRGSIKTIKFVTATAPGAAERLSAAKDD